VNRIGLVGGMSYVSTVFYYEKINQTVNKLRGGQHSADVVIISPDFQIICEAFNNNDWETIQKVLSKAIHELEDMGCNLIGVCCNTVHHVFNEIKSTQRSKIIHILEPTIQAIKRKSIKNIGIIGTKFTLSSCGYCDYVTQNGLSLIQPAAPLIEKLNQVIFDEMCHGFLSEEGKKIMLLARDSIMEKGGEGIILGCTELGLFLDDGKFCENIFNSSLLHAEKIALGYCCA